MSKRSNVFKELLNVPGKQAVILDGGFGTELERIGKDYAQDPLWSARILADDPTAVQQVHRAYYNAGADVGTSCSYQATFAGFEKAGFSKDEAESLLKRSIDLCTAARDAFWASHKDRVHAKADPSRDTDGNSDWQQRRPKPVVAFSSGPFAACLADGSEYTGSYVEKTTFEQLVDFHRRKLQAVQHKDFDVIAFETVPSLEEGRAIAHLLRTEPPGKPAWLTFNCMDTKSISHGESFATDAIPLAFEADSLVAIGLNCTPPRFVPELLSAASAAIADKEDPPLLVAYPNSGEGWVNKTGKWDGNSDLQGCDLGVAGREWVEAGAKLVGGCCRTTPEYITSLAQALG